MTIPGPFLILPEAFAVALNARWTALGDFAFPRLTQLWFKQWGGITWKRTVAGGGRG